MKRVDAKTMVRGAPCLFVGFAVVLAGVGGALPAAAAKLVLQGATVHPVSGPDLPQATVLVDGERIAAVGAGVQAPPDARVVNVDGLHVYPALINASTVLGLVEISSVRGTVDVSETGDINPNVRAEAGVNPESELLPVTRANGVLVAMTAPRGGLVAGMAAVIRMDGWTREDMTIKAPVGLLVNWPSMRVNRGAEPGKIEEQVKARDQRLAKLRQAFADARAYLTARQAEGQKNVPAHDRDPRWEAMIPVLRRELPVFVVADEMQQIRAALRWGDEEGLALVFISGGDIGRAAKELAGRRIPVILTPTYDLPRRRWEPYDAPFTIARALHEAGVRFCFSEGGNAFAAANARNVPYSAAMAAAYGLPRQEALRGVTQYAAEILGVADRLGSVEQGKEATLIVTDGDPLEIGTHVLHAYIAGREVDLGNKQRRLYDKYRARPRPPSTAVPPAAGGARGR